MKKAFEIRNLNGYESEEFEQENFEANEEDEIDEGEMPNAEMYDEDEEIDLSGANYKYAFRLVL